MGAAVKPFTLSHLILITILFLLAGCEPPAAIPCEGWTLVDIVTESERRDFQDETVEVRNCSVTSAAAEDYCLLCWFFGQFQRGRAS